MALWNTDSNKKYVNLKLVAVAWPVEKVDWPKFVKLWENFEETWESYTRVSWKLTWIKPTFTPKKGKMWDIYWFKAILEDGDEVVVIESTITNASKDLLNWLLASKDKVVEVSLYINKNWYPTSSVRVDWNFSETYLPFNQIDNIKLFNWISEKFVSDKKDEVAVGHPF
jgi:hypothetical protein